MTKTRIAILLSGRGSNFLAIEKEVRSGKIPGEIVLVLSNKSDARGLAKAKELGLDTCFIPSKGKAREDYDAEVVAALRAKDVELVCLAGFMRLLSPVFIRAFPHRILNIHPGLLPSFKGLDAQKQALDYGAKVAGCTVHFVDEKEDHGPIVLQKAIPVKEGDTDETLSKRILTWEHRLYPEAVRLFCEGKLKVEGRRVRVEEK